MLSQPWLVENINDFGRNPKCTCLGTGVYTVLLSHSGSTLRLHLYLMSISVRAANTRWTHINWDARVKITGRNRQQPSHLYQTPDVLHIPPDSYNQNSCDFPTTGNIKPMYTNMVAQMSFFFSFTPWLLPSVPHNLYMLYNNGKVYPAPEFLTSLTQSQMTGAHWSWGGQFYDLRTLSYAFFWWFYLTTVQSSWVNSTLQGTGRAKAALGTSC